jgi:putative lipoic acid-binding regulatory protein
VAPPEDDDTKPLNDPTNPEYDDQGYTLYADEKTGKKTRVFEALVEYPCDFTMKIVGINESTFVQEIVAVVAESCETEPDRIQHSTRMLGKWTSVTVKVRTVQYVKVDLDLDRRVQFSTSLEIHIHTHAFLTKSISCMYKLKIILGASQIGRNAIHIIRKGRSRSSCQIQVLKNKDKLYEPNIMISCINI